ncbi:MAG TPA: GNAT family N-acetyltransferase, partial [Rhizobium sp.]
DGKRIGGMAYAAMDKDEGDVVLLQQLCVDPQLTGQGIGRDLFAEVETCFPAARRMRVEVPADSDKAIRFFRGLGFSEIGWSKSAASLDASSNSGIEARVLEKELSF